MAAAARVSRLSLAASLGTLAGMTDTLAATPNDVPFNLYRPTEPLMATVLENRRLTAPGDPTDVRHIVLRYPQGTFRFVEGQAVGIPPPGLNAHGRPNVPRLYSVACDRDGEDGSGCTVSLAVKRVVHPDTTGVPHPGLSSNYLCDATPGDLLPMTGPAGKDVLPADPAAPLLCIGVGTGVAPFRSFLRRRARDIGQHGPMWLFLGARTHGALLYRDEWDDFVRRDPKSRVTYAISGQDSTEDGRRMYVQDRMKETGHHLWHFLMRPGTNIHVCGIRGLEIGVEEALAELAARAGEDWSAIRADFVQSGRWHIATY